MDIQSILDSLKNIATSDYVLGGIILSFAIGFIFLGNEKIYKAYLGAIIGLFLFIISNLSLFALNQNQEKHVLGDFFLNHKEGILFYLTFFIPFLAIIFLFNSSVSIGISSNKHVKIFSSFFLGALLIPFFISILIFIVHNKFLFSIQSFLIPQLNKNFIVSSIFSNTANSVIFKYISENAYYIIIGIIFIVLYKISIDGIMDKIISKILSLLQKIFKK